ncbi:alpha-galactosidase [Edaphobacter flagellatus]|uniref:alpha-galactosidase n=1 Tax=Edaphobacter flagellatus TaxID=1933044 RepID=UPI0021B223C3|nr:alpha-galactosidase [Edaphobacter flagellatus]
MKKRLLTISATIFACGLNVLGQDAVRSVDASQQWYLNAGESTYVVGINERHMLQSLYWGPALPADARLPQAHSSGEWASFDTPANTTALEYPAWGEGLFAEPALKVDSPNGDRTLVLVYESAKVSKSELEIVLHDTVQPIKVHLFYEVFPQGILSRWSRIENAGSQTFVVEQAASAVWNLPAAEDYSLSWLTGQWAGEWQLHSELIQAGSHVMESRRGSTGHQANPWFAIGREHATTEDNGPVWFGELGWSGSWRMNVEGTSQNKVRVTAGYNPFDFAYVLEPGKSLETPKFYAGYTSHGQGEASRILHRFQLAEILPTHPNPKPRPVIYNSWEATEFAVNEAGQISLAEKAAKLGVERFVVDDGWFGQRLTDKAGLGDWYVNKTKFPNGLKPLIDRVHALGMDFGLWVEPEMVNPDSDLYRAHPDWAMHFPDRNRTEARNQLVLNLAREDVKEYVFNFLDRLVTENDIAFLKWDYNRNWSEPGWSEASGSANGSAEVAKQKEIYVRYVENLYDILAKLRAKHPKLEIESCSGGSGRVDLGILRYTDEVWTSDNTDALDRLAIQYGFTHAYAPETMAAWVTDVPNFLNRRSIPLQFRFLSAMQGALGIGGNLNKWTTDDMALATKLTAFYKDIRTTVQHGNLYRLQSPLKSESSHVEYVAQDGSQAVLFSYLRSQHFGMALPKVQLKGLEPKASYQVRALDAGKYKGEAVVSGAVLMGEGINLGLAGDYDSTAVVLERLETRR